MNYYSAMLLTLTMLASSNTLAVDIISCDEGKDSQCNVYIQKLNESDEVSYDAQLKSTKTDRPLFSGFTESTSMESLSLQIINERYVFMKESSASGKGIEFISFNFKNEMVEDLRYFYINSSVDVNNKILIWSGENCQVNKNAYFSSDQPSLFGAFAASCYSNSTFKYATINIGTDLKFDMKSVSENNISHDMTVLALDSTDSDVLDVIDIGCIDGCNITKDAMYYIGKINDKYRVSLKILNIGGDVSGYYYYDKQNKIINLKGRIDKGNVSLKTDGGELFYGKEDDGEIVGTWYNAKGDVKYSFVFYKALIQ